MKSRCILVAIASIFATFSLSHFLSAQVDQEAMREYMERNKEQVEKQTLLSQVMQLTFNKPMQEELSIVEDQIKDLQKVTREYQRLMSTLMAEHQDEIMEAQKLLQEGKTKEGIEMMEKLQAGMLGEMDRLVGEIESVLLPHQIDRLKQISKQQTSRFGNEFGDEFGVSYSLAKELGLSDEEKQKLKEAIEEAREEYYEQLEKIKKKANDKIMAAIPADKRDRLKEILGENFDFEKAQRESLGWGKKKAKNKSESEKK